MTLQELEQWYAGRQLPTEPIQIHKSTLILDPASHVEAQFRVIANNPSPKMQEPCISRLIQLKEWLEENGTPAHS
jgi:hypothetical protein